MFQKVKSKLFPILFLTERTIKDERKRETTSFTQPKLGDLAGGFILLIASSCTIRPETNSNEFRSFGN